MYNLSYLNQNYQSKIYFLILIILTSILVTNSLINGNSNFENNLASDITGIKESIDSNIKEIVSNNLDFYIGGFTENINQKSDHIKFFLQSSRILVGFSQSSLQMVTLDQNPKVANLKFVGSNKIDPIGINMLDTTNNYFIGSDKSDWGSAHNYKSIVFKNLYSNIDLYYHLQNGNLKYEFYVYPGANIDDIQLEWSGSVDILKNYHGMKININSGTIGNQYSFLDTNPINYDSELRNNEVSGYFKLLNDKTYGFEIPDYNKNKLLIIDPSIIDFGTYISGSDDDTIESIVLDASDNIYVTGYTKSYDFPTTLDAYHNESDALSYTLDVFLLKLSPNGSTLLYSTYISGSGNEYGRSIVLDSAGNIYITGETTSTDFPTSSNALNQTKNGGVTDAFIMKLAQNGSTILYSSYLGGSGDDDAYSIALDPLNNMYITGTTESVNFPVTSGAYDTVGKNPSSFVDGFVLKLNSDGLSLNYSTYISGSSYDTPKSIKVDNFGYAYISGITYSDDFPTTSSAYDKTLTGITDSFVTKISLDGSALNYSTYLSLGISTADSHGLAIDQYGNAFISGNYYTSSAMSLMVIELAANGSTRLNYKAMPAGDNTYGFAITLDNVGNVFVAGTTYGTNLQTTSDAINTTGDVGSSDAFVIKLEPDFTLAYSTYLGGSDADEVDAIAVNSKGHVITAGVTKSTDFPVTSGAFNTTANNNSKIDSFILSIDLQPENVTPVVIGPSDLNYESGTIDNSLDWTVGDVNPGVYSVTKDGVLVGMANIPWTNGTISINIDNLPVGSYEYNITVYDGVGNFIEDSVIVTVVDTTLPFVNNPSNRNYELGTTGNAINWTVGDVNPDVYNVTRNGVLIETKSWINGTISVNVDNLPVGIYEFNITVYDKVGSFIVDSVNVTVVDSTPPSVSGPSSFNYEFGTAGNKIEWTVGDVDPSNYNITVDNVLFGHQANLLTNGTISINVDGFDLGSYELNLTVFDVSGNFNSQTVSLTIIDTTAPLINDVNDIQYYEGSTGNEIAWNIDEIKGDMYIVYKDNEIIMTNA